MDATTANLPRYTLSADDLIRINAYDLASQILATPNRAQRFKNKHRCSMNYAIFSSFKDIYIEHHTTIFNRYAQSATVQNRLNYQSLLYSYFLLLEHKTADLVSRLLNFATDIIQAEDLDYWRL